MKSEDYRVIIPILLLNLNFYLENSLESSLKSSLESSLELSLKLFLDLIKEISNYKNPNNANSILIDQNLSTKIILD